MKNINPSLAKTIWRSGVILEIKEFDSEMGCTTFRMIKFMDWIYRMVMHNGEILEIKGIGVAK